MDPKEQLRKEVDAGRDFAKRSEIDAWEALLPHRDNIKRLLPSMPEKTGDEKILKAAVSFVLAMMIRREADALYNKLMGDE